MIDYFLVLALILFFYMNLWFIVSLLRKRNDVADEAWGFGFVVLAWASFLLGTAQDTRGIIVGILVSIWGTRLAWHIFRRHLGHSEDYRYAKWREDWGKWFYVRSYVQVYLLQGVLLFLIATPILLINQSAGVSLNYLDVVGIFIWITGFVFEVVGDAQLAQFKKDPHNKGKLLQTGLWNYSRHPNYFGEVLQWWGVFVLALSVSNGWFGIVGPLMITFLILKVSGIPLLEKKMMENPAFAEYQKKTSIFIPWFPK